jgi:alkylation response protein AidB-like acyl-CoA dehydrogenase
MVETLERMRQLGINAAHALPCPGGGATDARHEALLQFGRKDLSLARIAEAHTDALAILAEARRVPRAGALYGVWASDGPQSRITAEPLPGGRWRLRGIKQYCSAAGFATAALVTAHHDAAVLLFDVAVDHGAIRVLPSTWASPALADTATGPVSFAGVTVGEEALIGTPNWYLTRPGFWHGAIGPAACWAGGAISLVEAAAALNRRDPHSRAQVGALQSVAWGLSALLAQAGREIDADPLDDAGEARVRALKVRHLVERWCTDVLDRFGRATGPQLLAYDAHIARQHMALNLYMRQCHAERDLETIPAPFPD